MFNFHLLCWLVSYLIVLPIYVHDEEPSKTYITQDFYLKLFALIQAQHRLKAQTFLDLSRYTETREINTR